MSDQSQRPLRPSFDSTMKCQLIDFMGGDDRVTQAARVSTRGEGSIDSDSSAGLINYLVRERHGSPLEHSVFQFLIRVPGFVVWELVRHRIASYNIESSRYRQLKPEFYLPPRSRKLVQIGRPGDYQFHDGSDAQYQDLIDMLTRHANTWWTDYSLALGIGLANEVARMSTPFHLYWSAYLTINTRSLMNLLSLRTFPTDDTAIASHPAAEIAHLADLMELDFAIQMPLTYAAWKRAGRSNP